MSLSPSVHRPKPGASLPLAIPLHSANASGIRTTKQGLKAVARSVAALFLTLALLPGGAEGDAYQEPSLAETLRVVASYTCKDEHEAARSLSAVYLDTALGELPFQYGEALVALWDGTPFVVDVSSSLRNADRLLEVVAQEAERIRAVLGYEIFVAGDVLQLADVSETQLTDPESASRLNPPHQHVDILCCYGLKPQVMGVANPHLRLVVLRNDPFGSRYAIIHELYHLLGFAHPGEPRGVEMSEALMHGVRAKGAGLPLPTRSTPNDLARLACIYD